MYIGKIKYDQRGRHLNSVLLFFKKLCPLKTLSLWKIASLGLLCVQFLQDVGETSHGFILAMSSMSYQNQCRSFSFKNYMPLSNINYMENYFISALMVIVLPYFYETYIIGYFQYYTYVVLISKFVIKIFYNFRRFFPAILQKQLF